MGQSCLIFCLMSLAKQFDVFKHHEPEFAESFPLAQRYGEMLNLTQVKKEYERGVRSSTRCW